MEVGQPDTKEGLGEQNSHMYSYPGGQLHWIWHAEISKWIVNDC